MVFSREIQHCVASGHRGFGENWSSSYQGVIDSHHISKFYQLSLPQDFSHHCTCDSYGMALDKLISNLQITYWITLDDVKSEYSTVINKIFILIIKRTRKISRLDVLIHESREKQLYGMQAKDGPHPFLESRQQ